MDTMHGRTESKLTLLVRQIRVALHIPKYWHDDPAKVPGVRSELWVWHIHHMQLVERMWDSLQARIDWIRQEKPLDEIDTRLRLLTIVRDQDAMNAINRTFEEAHAAIVTPRVLRNPPTEEELDAYGDEWQRYENEVTAITAARREAEEELHKLEHPNCPWDGRTIFPDKPNAGFR